MSNLLTSDLLALGLLLTDELYQVKEEPALSQPVLQQPEVAAGTQTVAPAVFDYLGGNNKFILFLLSADGHAFASPETLEALEKILKGLKMTMEDIALVNLFHYPAADLNSLKAFFACSKVVLFGPDPKKLGMPNLSSNIAETWQGLKLLSTYSFEEMNTNDQKKRTFWNEIKTF